MNSFTSTNTRPRIRPWLSEQTTQFAADYRRIGYAILAVTGASAAMLIVREQLGVLNITLLFLLLSFILGLWLGMRPAMVGATLSFLIFDLAFLKPYYTLTVAAPDHVLALFVYLAAAIASSVLVSRVREQTWALQRETRRTTLLYDLNRALVLEPTLHSLLQTITRSVVEIYGARGCRMLTVSEDEAFTIQAWWPDTLTAAMDRDETTVARWVVQKRIPAGLATSHTIRKPGRRQVQRHISQVHRAEDVLYVPVTTRDRVPGVLEIIGRPGGGQFHEDDMLLLGSFADQAALALDRTRLMEEAAKTAVFEQASILKSSLIAAVSHDLRTPLTAIKASASAMLDTSVAWTSEDRQILLQAINEETDRLTFMVSNLLDLSRIEGGALRPDKEWHDVGELIENAVRRANQFFPDRHVEVQVDPTLPLVPMDWVYMSQILLNLLNNAAKYTPSGTPIFVSAHQDKRMLEIRVQDEGPGITRESLPHIFETFYRVQHGNTISGSGIGLSICKGLVEAQGGRIWVESKPGKGATFFIQIPMEEDLK